jgi:hypothetical protein
LIFPWNRSDVILPLPRFERALPLALFERPFAWQMVDSLARDIAKMTHTMPTNLTVAIFGFGGV